MGDLWGYKDDPEHWNKFPYPWCNLTELEDILKLAVVAIVIVIAVAVWL